MAVSKVDAANQIENQLPQANIAGNVNFRNIFINGDMSIAQRGTSAANISTGGYYTCDRWRVSTSSAAYEFTMSQDTDVPTGQGFAKSLKMDCTTAQTDLGTSSHLYFEQKIEGQNLQYLKKGTDNAESVTLSFWVKSNKTGTYSLTIFDYDNTRQIASTYTINTANTWEKKTVTFVGDTTGTLDNDNAVGLSVFFSLALGTNRTDGTLQTSWGSYVEGNWGSPSQVNLADSTDNEWYITGVQLEAGTTASDFEFLPADVNLQRCRRYYQERQSSSLYINRGYASEGYIGQAFSPIMRANPTMTWTMGNISQNSLSAHKEGIRGYITSAWTTTPSYRYKADAEL